ncbi:Uncaracterized surface protein containing fasciclin (FAS1) repeats [Cyclobacterium lianum]|uniref:Uncaracterized surface protein containing fasciclin (FAS1) repeats n=2 Tax=Cyclobacterium lianum TaxID=388280 RepID=A0A1M7Q9Z4_9BACT|nr:Uncaracterized surface protein containing fasciclin (FAS1) repeats [Cyclobacterium lianum]
MSVFAIAMLLTATVFANDEVKEPVKKAADKDIVDLAAGTDFLSTLVAAVKAGGLVDVLKGDGPFTVFAPTNEAFAKLPAGTVENLLKPDNKDQLVKILTYHVVPGNIKAADLENGMEVETVQGQKIKVKLASGKAMINEATVTSVDIEASNGMVHVIDSVILPEM